MYAPEWRDIDPPVVKELEEQISQNARYRLPASRKLQSALLPFYDGYDLIRLADLELPKPNERYIIFKSGSPWIKLKSGRELTGIQPGAGCSILCRAGIATPYTLDAMLPALRMGSQMEWNIAAPAANESAVLWGLEPGIVYPILRFFKLVYAAIGTALMALAVLTWTGVLRRGRNA